MKKNIISAIKQLKFNFFLEKFTKIRSALLVLFFVGVALDVFFLKVSSDLFLFLLIFLWILVSKVYGYKSTATFKVTLFFVLLLLALFIITPGQTSSERISTWIYLFLAVGIIQQWRENSTR